MTVQILEKGVGDGGDKAGRVAAPDWLSLRLLSPHRGGCASQHVDTAGVDVSLDLR